MDESGEVIINNIPWEMGSARLSPEAMYVGEIMILASINEDVIWQMQLLWAGLQERPLEKAPITPVLSE